MAEVMTAVVTAVVAVAVAEAFHKKMWGQAMASSGVAVAEAAVEREKAKARMAATRAPAATVEGADAPQVVMAMRGDSRRGSLLARQRGRRKSTRPQKC